MVSREADPPGICAKDEIGVMRLAKSVQAHAISRNERI
jgi:hypothetical protein